MAIESSICPNHPDFALGGRFKWNPAAALNLHHGRFVHALEAIPETQRYCRNSSISRGQATVYRINDNDGQDFVFEKERGSNVWFCQDAVDQALRDVPRSQAAPPRRLAQIFYYFSHKCEPRMDKAGIIRSAIVFGLLPVTTSGIAGRKEGPAKI
jgi:hypothetical protein